MSVTDEHEFSEKNRRRRAHFDGADPKHRAARKLRRSRGGAFGHAERTVWNQLIVGTSGAEREREEVA